MSASHISAQQYAALHKSQPALVTIDVRTPPEVAGENVPNSHNLPLQDLDQKALDGVLKRIDCGSEQTVYLLCQAGQRARMASEKAGQLIANPLVIIEGGINSLRATDLSLQSSATPVMSLERQVRIAAGSLVLGGTILGYTVNPAFYGLAAFVGAGLTFAGITDTCAMGMALARMPWNK